MSIYRVIKDTCPCGAHLSISGEYVSNSYETWLEAHKPCREAAADRLMGLIPTKTGAY